MLANLYMLEVDKQIHDLVEQYHGFYMRYSDDFIVIEPDEPNNNALNVFSEVRAFIASAPSFKFEASATQYFFFIKEKILKILEEIYTDVHNIIKFF